MSEWPCWRCPVCGGGGSSVSYAKWEESANYHKELHENEAKETNED